MSAAEEKTTDLPRRMAFADALDRELLTSIRGEPWFAGVWIDQATGGGATIALTDLRRKADIDLTRVAPNLGVQFIGAVRSDAQLTAALERLSGDWEGAGGPKAIGFGIDVRNNQLRVDVLYRDVGVAQETAQHLQAASGVPIGVRGAADRLPHDVACTSRTTCYDPYKGGRDPDRGPYHRVRAVFSARSAATGLGCDDLPGLA